MNYISKIEILYFRSIYRETISGLSHFNMFTGKNDAGKSNILKALNLFFNGYTDTTNPLVFEEDFNFRRASEVRKESIKGKRFIQIKITFNRGNSFLKTLPEQFTVTKNWGNWAVDGTPSSVTDNVESQMKKRGLKYNDRSKSSLTQFLNRMRYFYVPAIKDETVFRSAINSLRDTILNKTLSTNIELATAIEVLNNQVATSSQDLNDEFERATNISTQLSTPKEMIELYQTMNISTNFGTNVISLSKRGDGIRVRYLPTILHYIAKSSNKSMIWGFEEPENSLEYNLAEQMAQDFNEKYSKESQIFVSSHSPSFLSITSSSKTKIYRCFNRDCFTKILPLETTSKYPSLAEELGYVHLQNEIYKEYTAKKAALEEKANLIGELQRQIADSSLPVLYTEGKTDVAILETAWNKLFDTECPFLIKSCNPLAEDDNCSAGGCETLSYLLGTIPHDSLNIVIGLFDRDDAGSKAFQKLSKIFIESEEGGVKSCRNKKSHAILLPVPPGKDAFDEATNLQIEFYFEKKYLDTMVDGRKLQLNPKKIETRCGSKVIRTEPAIQLQHHEIDSSTKVFFSEYIVPTFPKEAFVDFVNLFNIVLELITVAPKETNL